MRLLLLSLLFAAPAWAQRVAPVFAGAPSDAQSAVDVALLDGLKGAGLIPVDASQSRIARSVDDLGRLLDGGAAPVVTDLDADWLLVVRVRTTPVQSDLLGPNVTRIDVSLQVKLVAVDTGEVRLARVETAPGVGFGPAPAVQKSAAGAVKALIPHLKTVMAADAPGRVQVSVEGCPNMTACAGVLDALRTVDGIEDARSERARRGLSRWTVQGRIEARSLALALDAVPGLGLDVHGHGPGTVYATYAPRRAINLAIRVPARFGRDTLLADIVHQAVAAQGVGRPVRADDARVAVTGSATRRGKDVRVSLEARHGDRSLAATQFVCPRATVARCAIPPAQAFAKTLQAAILADRTLTGGLPPPAPTAAARALSIEEVTVGAVLPAHAGRLADAPLGEVVLRNRGERALTDLVVQARLPGFAAPVDTRLARLQPGKTARVPVRLALDTARLRRHDTNRSLSLDLLVEYRDGTRSGLARRRHPVVLYDRNAMRWDDPEALAAFVDARNAHVGRVARTFAAAAPDGEPLGVPAALYSALAGLRYLPDPVHPMRAETLDYVQFPAQTLATGTGDCDDLTVLYAALAEAVGRRTLLLILPGHALVAVETGWPRQARMHLAVEADQLIEYDGALFLPLELTARDADFATAWRKGAAALRGVKTLRIDTRKAWAAWPAVDLAGGAAVDPPTVDAAAIKRNVEGARSSWRAAAEARLGQVSGPAERGALLAVLGRHAEAKAILAKVQGAAGVNNRGNLAFEAGDLPSARAAYAQAAKAAPDEPRIRLNAALAAHAAGDGDAFADHVLECLERGGADLVESLAKAGLTGPALSAVLRKAGRRTLDPSTVARRADAPPAHRFVYWL